MLNILKISLILSASSIILVESRLLLAQAFRDGLLSSISTTKFTKVGHKLYSFEKQQVSWYLAMLRCRDSGGMLASPENAAELAELTNYLASTPDLNGRWWLSAADIQERGNFVWYGTGNPMNFPDWSAAQAQNYKGEKHCVNLEYKAETYNMTISPCRQQLAYYICETRKPLVALITTLS